MTIIQRMDEHLQALLFEIGGEFLVHDADDEFSACSGIVSGDSGVEQAFISLPVAGYPSKRVAYFVALHEIAHLYQHLGVRGFTVKPWITTTLAREAHAWKFALRESRYKATKQVWRHILACLLTYEYHAEYDARYKVNNEFKDLLYQARKESE